MPRRTLMLITLALLLAACNTAVPIPTFVPTFTPSLVPTDTPTATPTTIPTPTPLPTSTPLPTFTPTPTSTPTPAPTSTSLPIPLGSSDRFTFAVCGDNQGSDVTYREILDQAVADGSAFIVHVGDVVNEGEIDQLEHARALMAAYPMRIFIAPGNHELLNGTLDNYVAVFRPPAFYYSFDYGRVHFVILDASLGSLSTAQLDWLRADLAATLQTVKMVFLHYPPFDPAGTNHTLDRGRESFIALMQRYGVQFVFAGHIHTFDHELRNGTHYYITGGAGGPLYSLPQREAWHHYLRVGVDGDQVQVELVRLDELH